MTTTPPEGPPLAPNPPETSTRRLVRSAQVIIVTGVMFTFISYWRTAAIVLCDLASTAYYIGGIVEQSIGPAAPWFILAVMFFSYAVRSVYIESCTLFVRGGVYRVVREALGKFMAKLAVSALIFDYILTGPISGVSAGQYIMGLLLDSLAILAPELKISEEAKDLIKRWGAVVIASGVTLYFFRENLRGIHESSGKALKIMVATTIMGVIMILWCLLTLIIRGPVNPIARAPDLSAKVEYASAAYFKMTEDSFRALKRASVPDKVRDALEPLREQELKSEKEFKAAAAPLLAKAGVKWEDYQAPLLAYAKVVEDYDWTSSKRDTIKSDVPESVLDKLAPLLKKDFTSTRQFEERLAELLSKEELEKYKYLILDESANTKVTDRVTGEKRALWARDPDTGALIPKLDANGNPRPKISKATGHQEDPKGFLTRWAPSLAEHIARPGSWLSIFALMGVFIAFGHSILAMSGEETLAQVYREVESPKLPNFKKAAFIVFVYSLALTGTISFLAVALIPDEVRMKDYSENLIGGLAMYVWGHPLARLALNFFVVVVGFLILSGAVNTAIIGSNGVLNRVAEDGVLPDWFLKPHPRYGTTYRLLYLIIGLQLFTIIVSRGDVLLLGEAYAFGVVWSFVFQALSMVVLRFTDKRPRESRVPLNVKFGSVEVPFGLLGVLFLLLMAAIFNLLTKEIATIGGIAFTGAFFTLFYLSERYHEKKLHGAKHEHIEQFNQATAGAVTAAGLGLTKPFHKLVSIRSTHNLFMLEKALAETDPETTDVVVMTAKVLAPGGDGPDQPDLDAYDQQLMTAVVDRAEKAGKQVKPLIVPTNNPLHAVLNTAKDLHAHELIMGASNKYTADEQLEQIAFYWISLHDGQPAPLTVRILSRERDMYLDLSGGNRIPKISERSARSVAELRAAGVGVDRVLVIHDGSPTNSDLFQGVLTMLDPEVALGLVPLVPPGADPLNGHGVVHQDEDRARKLDRPLTVHPLQGSGLAETAVEIVDLARTQQYDLIVLLLPGEAPSNPLGHLDVRTAYIVQRAHCRVFLATTPVIPQEVVDMTPSAR